MVVFRLPINGKAVPMVEVLMLISQAQLSLPATPENEELLAPAFANDPPLPVMIVHKPVPTRGIFPASVTEVDPHVIDAV